MFEMFIYYVLKIPHCRIIFNDINSKHNRIVVFKFLRDTESHYYHLGNYVGNFTEVTDLWQELVRLIRNCENKILYYMLYVLPHKTFPVSLVFYVNNIVSLDDSCLP